MIPTPLIGLFVKLPDPIGILYPLIVVVARSALRITAASRLLDPVVRRACYVSTRWIPVAPLVLSLVRAA